MNSLAGILAAAGEMQSFCTRQAWRFCFIGGLAVQRWGMPRFTQDVDVTVLTGVGNEHVFVDALLARFPGRLPEARPFALENRVVLARTADGVDLDIALGAFPFDEGAVTRATAWRVGPELTLTTCIAEDLVIHKAFAGRDRDWADIEGILIRQHGRMDMTHVRRELRPLLELKEDSAGMDRLERMIAAVTAQLR